MLGACPWLLVGFVVLALSGATACGSRELQSLERTPAPSSESTPAISLPQPRTSGPLSLEEALAGRRSVRSFAERSLGLAQVAQLLWAAQGVTDARTGYRAAPSAGALYPLEVVLAVKRVRGLTPGVYRYVPDDHALLPVRVASPARELSGAAHSQAAVGEAPVVLVLTAVYERTTARYGARGERYAILEAGHAAQNVYLQAEALELGTVAIGAFDDEAVRRVLGLKEQEQPLYLMPCGEPARR